MTANEQQKPTYTDDLFTTEEAGELLRVTAKTVRLYIDRGLIEASQVGRKYLIRRTEIIRFIRSRRKRR